MPKRCVLVFRRCSAHCIVFVLLGNPGFDDAVWPSAYVTEITKDTEQVIAATSVISESAVAINSDSQRFP